ncbi:hypothetical protein ACIGO8_30980 [Streptomyces sp. NPDC053493]|uniref:hypothetical protein n=1 Tax=Streptomyces sp. NPDC053493 TaxID=3365705 RepID=UPI0037CD86AE
MSLRTKAATTASAAALAFAGVLGAAGPSTAASNGQQIHFHDSSGSVYSIRIEGYNQNGDVASGCFATPGRDTWVGGWWWKGEVTVTFYKTSSCSVATYFGETNAWVPTSQSGDWTTVSS